ncbi:GAF domain-containing protein [Confluentibacter flavum]|uniref:GAF domain-containing protein n=1 Tax=Confluentibacter flavum TaxID=1909700 RepID=A0A2N3HFD5_9FLAO|nr:GAF domain-containing protein [Confluentibacter flavum]PKQ43686.1 GAF domain-containing protein [Confluentibacter flavum]
MYQPIESPMLLQISFKKLLEQYEALLGSGDDFMITKAKHILEFQEKYPALREGFTDFSLLETYKEPIKTILQDSFSPLLTYNEIKTASVPFQNIIFNASARFKNIIKTAGKDFELKIKNMPEDDTYIIACTVILNFCYGYNLSLKRPMFYEIPDAHGIKRYYKILYNADFCEIVPTDKAVKITQDDYEELLDNFGNIELWKAKFPPNSHIFKGFVISNIFDVTDDQSISNIKSSLIGEVKQKDENFIKEFQNVFQSLLGLKDLKVGFSVYNKEEDSFERVLGEDMVSFLVNKNEGLLCESSLCHECYDMLLNEKKFYSISDVDKFDKLSDSSKFKILKDQGIKSAILAPIASNGELLGILELVSSKPKVLNSINANKLVDIMPFIVSTVERSKKEEHNLIEAVIQQECTSIHPSVSWKFKNAAKKFLFDKQKQEGNATFKKIVFENVYPLFGQMDIKGSSDARNKATQRDLTLQLSLTEKILEKIESERALPIYSQIRFQIESFKEELTSNFKVDSELILSLFFKNEIEPLFKFLLKQDHSFNEAIHDYFSKIDESLGLVYHYRKNYDDTVALINKNMARLLDEKQVEAQKMYPHFFERFKTDGVEHNMYIGETITKEDSFNIIYLYNLRLWQLQAMCEMENAYYSNQDNYPLSLDIASMILVFNQPLSIRFRMDEKKFDVDGTYNARYEVVKKRVDKAFIKGTQERITGKGKIAIVYSHKEDEIEYLRYIKFLQSKKMLDIDEEIVELENLQGVTGLKAIRVSLLYKDKGKDAKNFFTYNDLMNEIKA